ncbi:unnamed protein product [Closterium sp. NIES-54]
MQNLYGHVGLGEIRSRPLGPATRPLDLSALATAATTTAGTAPTTATAVTVAHLLLLLLPSLSQPLPPRTPPSLPAMNSLRRSGGSGDGGGGSSGSGGGHPSSRCGAVRWGVSGGGQMRVQQRQHEAHTPQQLREWYTSRGGGGCNSGGRSAAVQLGVTGEGLPRLQRCPRETLSPQHLREWYVQRGASHGSARCPYVICTACRVWRRTELPRWLKLVRQCVDVFTLDYDAILTAMYALSASAEGDCSRCVPPDPSIAAAALRASESGTLPGTTPAKALHTFTLDSGALRCFFRDSTTLTPLPALVPVRLADPSRGPVVASSSTVLPCSAVPSGSLSGLHLPSFSTNLVSTTALQDVMVTTTTPGGQRMSICTCTRTGRHLATCTRRPGSSLYTLATEPPQVAESAQVSASGQVAASCSCRLLSHQTLLWHHRLGHPYLPHLRGMHSRLLVSGLPRSLPPLPPSPALPCLPCTEGRQRAAPHSSSFPPTTAPLQTLHMDVWGPARVSGQGREHYFLLPVDDYTRYTTVFPLRSKGEVFDVLIPWIRTVRLQLRERFGQDLPVLRLHSVARTSMIHSAAPHFLWPFATGEVGDASVFRVWGSRAFVRETSADKLSARAIPYVFLGFIPDMPGWQFYHPTSRRVFPSQDVTFNESVPFYRLFPYRSAPPPPPPLFLAPGPPPVDPLPPQCPTPTDVSQVDPLPGTAPVQVAVGSGAAPRAASGAAASGGEELGGAESDGAGSGGAGREGEEPGGAEPTGVETEGVELGGAESEGAESGGAEPRGAASSGVPASASPRLSPQQLHEWFSRRHRLRSAATGAGDTGDAGAGGAGVTARAGGAGAAATGPGGARTRGTGAAGAGGVEGVGAGDPTKPGATGAGGSDACGAGAAGAGAVDPGAGGAGDTVWLRPYFVPLLQQVLGVPSSTSLTPPLLCPPPDQSQLPLHPLSPLPAPSPCTEQSGGLTEHCEPVSCPVLPVCTAHRIPRSRPPPVPGTHAMALRPSSVPLRVALPTPPESSLPEVPDPECDRARGASPTVSRLLATAVTDPSFESAAASALVPELLDFVAPCRLDYATALVAESASAGPPSVGGECALGTDILEDRQEDFECLAAAVPRFASMLLAPEGDLDAPSRPRTLTQRRLRAPREWHNTLMTTLAALGFAPATTDPSLFLRTDTSLSPFYVLVYVDDLVFATADTEALPLVKSELQKRHTCTDLGELRSYLGLQITRDRAQRTITLTQSHMVHQVLQRFGFQFSSPQPTPLSTSHSLSAPPSDESVEPSGPYPELVGCLMYRMTCTRPDLAYPLSLLARYVAPGRHRKRSSQGYTFCLGSGSVSWRSTHSSSVLSSSCEAEIYAGAMAAQELWWLTYLLTDLGEAPRSPPVLYVDNKAMLALCQEYRPEHTTKHIALRYFLARELQQRGQLRLAYVATTANTADVFTEALPRGDHQRFATVLGLVLTFSHLLTA